jgi:dTDP-4-amino-4,6-dideoxygalactose transaminase
MKVPFLDLKAQYHTISEEIDTSLRHVLSSSAFSGGPFVERFEEQFALFCQCRHAIGVGSGTEALWLALLALGVGQGDEVITVPNSFIATAEAISLCGATPVFVDVDEQSCTMNPALLDDAITPRTKAIIPVHLYGQTADMDPIMAIAKQHGLYVIEDACQAHGAEYKGKRAGSMGDAGCFSFYPGKNLGAYGEAGGIVTNNQELATRVKMVRDHGQSRKYYHDMIGVNGRMDGFQGAVLGVKLKYLTSWNEARMRNAEFYRAMLDGVDGIVVPRKMDYAGHVYHIFAVRVCNRDAFIAALTEKGIGCGVHYPVPIHLQAAYGFLGKGQGSFPIAERLSNELVSLPMFAELTEEQIECVTYAVKSYLRHTPSAPDMPLDARFLAAK